MGSCQISGDYPADCHYGGPIAIQLWRYDDKKSHHFSLTQNIWSSFLSIILYVLHVRSVTGVTWSRWL